MNHYQKLGVFSFRLIGVLQIFFSFIGAIYNASVTNFISNEKIYGLIMMTIIFGVIFSIPGVAMFLLSKKLGKFVGKNLDH